MTGRWERIIDMKTVTLGKTGITVNKNGFGALPIQRISKDAAAGLLQRAFEAGIRYFDTARAYSDSEEKIGYALCDVRKELYIATKTGADNAEDFWRDIHTSLEHLKTDYIDVMQFHNPSFLPVPGGKDGLYDAIMDAKRQGMVRHIGITNHRLPVAKEAVASGMYETIQFPFSYLAAEPDLALVGECAEKGIGFVAMKGLSGGLINNSAAAYAYLAQFDHVLPIWGVQRPHELEEFISYIDNPPTMTDEIKTLIEYDRGQLCGDFCRACGYCMPCPMGIEINTCARMSLLLRRAPHEQFLVPEMQEEMNKIDNCLNCGHCRSKCPYGLDTPALLRRNLVDYREVLAGKSVTDQ